MLNNGEILLSYALWFSHQKKILPNWRKKLSTVAEFSHSLPLCLSIMPRHIQYNLYLPISSSEKKLNFSPFVISAPFKSPYPSMLCPQEIPTYALGPIKSFVFIRNWLRINLHCVINYTIIFSWIALRLYPCVCPSICLSLSSSLFYPVPHLPILTMTAVSQRISFRYGFFSFPDAFFFVVIGDVSFFSLLFILKQIKFIWFCFHPAPFLLNFDTAQPDSLS